MWLSKIELSSISEIKESFKNIYKITNICKLQSFQYRLLHNKIFCNNILYYWKKSPSQKCENCDEKETPLHLFVECKYTQDIWEQTQDFLEEYGFNTPLSAKNIILNTYGIQIVDFIILVVKQLIFRCKCQKNEITWQAVVNELDLLYKIELHNAMVSNKMSKHCNKWRYIKPESAYITPFVNMLNHV